MAFMFKVTRYCLQMYLKTLETSVLKYMNLIMLIFRIKLELLKDIEMLLMVEKGIRG